jgi:hypothetical protein
MKKIKAELFSPVDDIFVFAKTKGKWLIEKKPNSLELINSNSILEACQLPYSKSLRKMGDEAVKAKRGFTSDPKILETLPNLIPHPLANAFKNQSSQVVNLRTLLPEAQDEVAKMATNNFLENSASLAKDPTSKPKLLKPEDLGRINPTSVWNDLIATATKTGNFILVVFLKHKKIIFLVTALGFLCLHIFLKKRRAQIDDELSLEKDLVYQITLELIKEITKANNDLEKLFGAMEKVKKQNPSKSGFGEAASVDLSKDEKRRKKRVAKVFEMGLKKEVEGLDVNQLKTVAAFVEEAKEKTALWKLFKAAGLDLNQLDLLSASEKINFLAKELLKAQEQAKTVDKLHKVSLIKEKALKEGLNEIRKLNKNIAKSKDMPYEAVLAITLILANPNMLQTVLVGLRLILRNFFRFPGDRR